MKYIPLNIKTEYDLMNSLIKIDELISYALENGINTLGITDSNMFGAYDFINKCKKNNIKPIVGIEVFVEKSKLLIYAKNYDGYVSLCKIVSKRNLDNLTIDFIKEFSSNIIIVCEYKDYSKYKDLFTYIYVGFDNDNELTNALLLTEDVVYIPLIRYFNKEDIEFFKYIKHIDEGKTIDEEINIEESYFKDIENNKYIESTIKFNDLINIEFKPSTFHIPVYKDDSKKFLRALAKKGLEKRFNGNVSEEYKERLTYELNVIEKMNYVDYFLIVYDFVLFAKKHGIWVGPGRGSGAASLVNYALGIINIDPLKYGLIFERFLNPDRITMPDIDIDFDNLRREEVIKYVSNKYGYDKTSRIISFNTMLPKQIIRDVAKVIKMENTLVDSICKTIKGEKDFEELKQNNEFITIVKRNQNVKELIRICNKLCGLKKNTSMHAAGVVISDVPLDTIMPLYNSNGVTLTGYSMDYIESLGLLKMDFLSLKNLNTISNIINDINSNGINIDINNIDLNDKRTLNLFKYAYTNGVFQFESDGMKSFLKTLEVDSFDTLIDAIALYRPGPRGMIPEYIDRKKGKKKVTYLVKELEPILKSTYGIIIYQEQVLEILRKISGYSYAEADVIRRAMSKKKYDVIEKEKERFFNGVINHGYTKEIASELYDLIIKFSEYGFNKSHSVVYSLVAFQMAYLKINYTLYFMRNLLNMNKSSEKLKEYLDESKLLHIEFENIDINKSCYEFIVDNNKLVLPFSIIRSIAKAVSEEIEEERKNGLFKDFYNFMIRCYGKSINKKVVIALIECGAFDKFNINKKQIVNNIDEVLNYVALCKDLNMTLDNPPVFDEINDFNDKESIDNEIKNYGFYISFHPVTKYDRSSAITLKDFKKYFDKTITTILYVESIKTIRTKNNDKMSFLRLSDEYGSVEGIIFGSQYKNIGEVLRNNVYKINCKVEKRNNEYQLIIYNMSML